MKKTLKLVLLTVLALALTVCAFTACNQKVATGIELKDAKTEFVVGDEFTYDGIKVTVVYDDGTTEAATDFKVDSSAVKKDTAGAYTVKVTVTVGDKTLEKTYTVNYAAAPHVHEYGTLVAEVAATCETAGTKAHYQCSGCQKYFDADKKEVTQESLVIAAKGHPYGDLIEEVAASCKATGTQAHYKCSECNKLFNESKQEVSADSLVIAITDHNYGTLVAKQEATCEEAGKNAYYQCSVCEQLFDENKTATTAEALVIAAKGHSYGEIIAEVAATCTKEGAKAHYECACGKLFDAEKVATTAEALAIATIDHTYGELVAKQEATCTKTGVAAHYECSVCNQLFDENKVATTAEALVIAIDSANHEYGELVEEVAATCTKAGAKAHYECACGKYFTAEKVETTEAALTIAINPENHTYGELIAKTVSTCAVKGEEAHYECACGKYFTAEKNETTLEAIQSPIDESNHDYGALIEEKAPTCVKEGAKAHYECACGKLFDAEKAETTAEALAIAMIDHNYQGIDQKCSMCGALDYASFEDVIKQGSGKTFKIVGKVVAIYGGNPYQGIFIANGEYALQVYKTSNAMAEGIAVGDIVEVVGKYAWYANGRTIEIDVSGSGSVLKKLNAAPDHGYTAPVDYAFDAATWATITSSSTAADNIYTNRAITVTGVAKGSANGTQFVITVDGVEVTVFYKGDSNITAEIKQAISLVAVGKTVTVTGVVGSYKGATQIVAPVVVDVQLTQEEKDALALAEAIEGLEGAYLTEKTELSTKATWESKSENVVIALDETTGKYTITITAGEAEIDVVLTATVGDQHQDVTMKIKAKTSGEDPEPVVKTWKKVTDASTLKAGDIITLAYDKDGTMYYMGAANASKGLFGTATDLSNATQLVLGKSNDNWTLSVGEQLLGAGTAKTTLKLGEGTTTWTISIAASTGKATICNTNVQNNIIYFNASSPRFANYLTAQSLPEIWIYA